jgi:hypothetical protein
MPQANLYEEVEFILGERTFEEGPTNGWWIGKSLLCCLRHRYVEIVLQLFHHSYHVS